MATTNRRKRESNLRIEPESLEYGFSQSIVARGISVCSRVKMGRMTASPRRRKKTVQFLEKNSQASTLFLNGTGMVRYS